MQGDIPFLGSPCPKSKDTGITLGPWPRRSLSFQCKTAGTLDSRAPGAVTPVSHLVSLPSTKTSREQHLLPSPAPAGSSSSSAPGDLSTPSYLSPDGLRLRHDPDAVAAAHTKTPDGHPADALKVRGVGNCYSLGGASDTVCARSTTDPAPLVRSENTLKPPERAPTHHFDANVEC